jgi:hypothetical protein
MATVAGEIVYKITGDSSGLTGNIKKADASVSGFSSGLKKMGGLIAAAFSVGAVIAFTKSIIKSASDAEETANKFGVVFSSISKEANDTADAIAKSFGLSNQAAKELISTTGNIAQSFGMSQKASLNLAANITTLSADLVSFTNYAGGVEGASRAITSALIGEREALKGLGISITEEELKKLAETQGRSIATMTAAEKATLTYQLILTKAKNAVGDFERSQYSFANQLRVADANVSDLSASLGKNLIPFASLGLRSFNEMSESILQNAEAFNKFVTSAEGADKIATVMSNIAGAFAAFGLVVKPVGDEYAEGVTKIVEATKRLLKPLGDTDGKLTAFTGAFTGVLLPLRLTVAILGNMVKDLINLGSALIQVGITAVATGKYLAGAIDAKTFASSVTEAKTAFVDFAKGVNSSGLDVERIIKETFSGENSAKAADAAEKFTSKLKAGIQKGLTASTTTIGTVATTDGIGGTTGATGATGGTPEAQNLSVWEQIVGMISEAEKAEEKGKTATEQWAKSMQTLADATSNVSNVLSAAAQLTDAIYEKKLQQLDDEMNAELEKNGVLTESATMKAQSEYDEAVKTGDALTIKNAQDALKKAQIEEKYAKKKKQLEYEGAHAAWEFQVAMAAVAVPLAILNAISAGAKFGIPGMVAYGAAAAVVAGVQMAAVITAEPQKPKFANGGIVPGTAFAGDAVQAQVNSGEMVLTKEQQGRLFAQANGQGGMMRVAPISKESILDVLFKASQSGELFISQRAVVAR